MLLSLTFLLLFFAVAVRQATLGFFSAMLMTVLTICCAALALGTHEWVAAIVFAAYWQPNYAHALALAITFGVPLLILRLVLDRLVRRACLLPSWVDKLGGGFCGLITGLVITGIAAASLQMIPFGGPILGFSRIATAAGATGASTSSQDAKESELWLTPDRFVAGLGYLVSSGVFSGDQNFYRTNPDWVRAIGWENSAEDGVSTYAAPNSINIQGTQTLQNVFRIIPPQDPKRDKATVEPIEPKPGREYKLVRVKLLDGARDENKNLMFSLRQFRLVGSEGSQVTQYYPIAIKLEEVSESIDRHVRYRKDNGVDIPAADGTYTTGNDSVAQIAFDLPQGFQPDFLEYKRLARAKVAFSGNTPDTEKSANENSAKKQAGGEKSAAATPSAPPRSAATDEAKPSSGRRVQNKAESLVEKVGGAAPAEEEKSEKKPANNPPPEEKKGGNIRVFTSKGAKSFFGDQMPLELKQYRGEGTEIERGKLVSGKLVGELDKQANGTSDPVSKFDVPPDKRLLQLNVGALETRSGLGRAISFAVTTVQNYFVTDSNGNRYEVTGKYAIANAAGTDYVEVQYFKERSGSVGGMGAFEHIKERDLKGDYQLVLLFLVEPGVQITGFSTGGDASRGDDLRAENLVAPK
ncbi:MAG: hypothetical protein HY287_17815 [Planctomycetes bacterium]|nr:hypothetical protein [Planctomycetota bacterium]MBI3836181.1 hypothetical protein [Planctomycetota bacterium]